MHPLDSITQVLRAGLRPGWILALSFFTAAHASAATAPNCPELQEWFQSKQNLSQMKRADLVLTTLLRRDEWEARNAAANRIYDQYLEDRFDSARFESCLGHQPDRGDFLNTLQSVFYSRSIERFRSASSPAIQGLLARLDQETQAGLAPLFRLTGQEFHQENPGPWNAGFHRGARSIYADFSRIPSSQWLLIFVHEILHGIDEELIRALPVYGDREAIRRFAAWGHQGRTFEQLEPGEQKALTAWIRAGLSRGLWAEYRAWLPSVVIYREGLRDRLWPKIGWMEEILNSRPEGQSLERFLYLYIDQKSPNPEEGIFGLPLVAEALQKIRAEYRSDPQMTERLTRSANIGNGTIHSIAGAGF